MTDDELVEFQAGMKRFRQRQRLYLAQIVLCVILMVLSAASLILNHMAH